MIDSSWRESGEYADCYVAFLDIMGMSQRVEESTNASSLVFEIAEVLNLATRIASKRITLNTVDRDSGVARVVHWVTQVRAFSDSIVLFVPVESGRLNDVLQQTIFIYDSFLAKRFLIRGAITIGKMYWDARWSEPMDSDDSATQENEIPPPITFGPGMEESYKLAKPGRKGRSPVTFGPGLEEANRLESTEAIYPCVMVSDKLVACLRENPDITLQAQVYDPEDLPVAALSPMLTYSDILSHLREDEERRSFHFIDVFGVEPRLSFRLIRDPQGRQQLEKSTLQLVSRADYLRSVVEPMKTLIAGAQTDAARKKLMWLTQYFNESIRPEDGIDPIPVDWGDSHE